MVTCWERTDFLALVHVYFVTSPYGVLGQVWYLIVSIHDLCLFSYFYNESVSFSLSFRLESDFSNQTLRKHVTSWDTIQLFQRVNFSLEMHARTSEMIYLELNISCYSNVAYCHYSFVLIVSFSGSIQ